jgi:hypothetical protein
VFDLTGITGIMKIPGGFIGETVALFQFTEQQASGIRSDPAACWLRPHDGKGGHPWPGMDVCKGCQLIKYDEV